MVKAKFQVYTPECDSVYKSWIYSCLHCRANFAVHDDLISKAFQGSQGRAYLFNKDMDTWTRSSFSYYLYSHWVATKVMRFFGVQSYGMRRRFIELTRVGKPIGHFFDGPNYFQTNFKVVNVDYFAATQRTLLTGIHFVADAYCMCCQTVVGWKYERAVEPSQRYKEGKVIIELAHMFKENGWNLEADYSPIGLSLCAGYLPRTYSGLSKLDRPHFALVTASESHSPSHLSTQPRAPKVITDQSIEASSSGSPSCTTPNVDSPAAFTTAYPYDPQMGQANYAFNGEHETLLVNSAQMVASEYEFTSRTESPPSQEQSDTDVNHTIKTFPLANGRLSPPSRTTFSPPIGRSRRTMKLSERIRTRFSSSSPSRLALLSCNSGPTHDHNSDDSCS